MKNKKRITSILEIEYELTNISDVKGFVDKEKFIDKLMNLTQVIPGISLDELDRVYVRNQDKDGNLHVQTFANNLRG